MKRETSGLVWHVEFLVAFALGLGLFFSIFGLRFCTSNSSSLLRFVAFVMLVEFLDAFALGRAASFGTKKGGCF